MVSTANELGLAYRNVNKTPQVALSLSSTSHCFKQIRNIDTSIAHDHQINSSLLRTSFAKGFNLALNHGLFAQRGRILGQPHQNNSICPLNIATTYHKTSPPAIIMAITEIADQYFTYEGRLASFQTAQQLSKRRASNASSKAPKSLKWPHKFLSAEEVSAKLRICDELH